MREAYAHCEALVRTADKDRYLATLLVPASARPHVFALYAFNAEIASIPDRVVQPMAGEIRLQWWRDVLSGNAAGDVTGNPVAAALVDTVDRHELPRSILADIIEARSFDLYDEFMPITAALDHYVRVTTSSFFALVARLLAGDDASISEAAAHAGLAYGITGLLRAFPLHASRGQIYLPADLLARHDARPDDILAGRTTPALLAALAEARAFARTNLAAAVELLKTAPESQQPAFLPVALVDGYLGRMDQPDYDPFRTPIEISQWRRQWTLWRAARRGL